MARKVSWILDFQDRNASKKIKGLDKALDGATSKFKGMDKASNKAGKGLKSFGNNIKSFGNEIKVASALAGGLTAIMVKQAGDIGKLRSEMRANASATKEEMEEFEKFVDSMDRRVGKKRIMEMGVTYASAGFDLDQIQDMLGGSDLMVTMGADEDTTANAISTAFQQYGLDSSEKVADLMAVGKSSAKQDIDDINQFASVFSGSAKQMNMDYEQVIAMTTILADANLVGSQAGTSANATYTDLINSMEDGAVVVGDTAVAMADANGELRPMPDILMDIESATRSMSQEQKAQALTSIFGANSMKTVNAFLNQGSDAYIKYEKSMYSARGEGEKMAEVMEDNVAVRMERVKEKALEASASFGEAMLPAIEGLVSGASKLVEVFNNLSPTTKKLIGYALLGVTALLPLTKIIGTTISVVGGLISIGSKLYQGGKILLAGVKAFNVVMASNPIIAGMMVAIAVGVLLYKNWDTIKAKGIELWEKIKELGGKFRDGWESLKEGAIASIESKIESIKSKFSNMIDTMKEKWESFKGFISDPIGAIKDKISGNKADGSHRTGSNYIPKDNYTGNLHKGEMVLTQQVANQYRKLGGTKDSLPSTDRKGSRLVQLPEINVSIGQTRGNDDAYSQGRMAGQGVRDEIEKYFRDMGFAF